MRSDDLPEVAAHFHNSIRYHHIQYDITAADAHVGGSGPDNVWQAMTVARRCLARCRRAAWQPRARRGGCRPTFDENLFKFENRPQRKATMTDDGCLPGCAAPLYVSLRCFNNKAWGPQANGCLACRAQRGGRALWAFCRKLLNQYISARAAQIGTVASLTRASHRDLCRLNNAER